MIRVHETALLVEECHSHDALLEHHLVFVGEFAILRHLLQSFRLVGKCAEEVGRNLFLVVAILHYALISHVSPFAQMLVTAHVPSEDTTSCCLSLHDHAHDELLIDMSVVRVYHLETLLIAHTFVGQQVAVQVDSITFSYIQFQHIIVADVERVLHDGGYLLGLSRPLSDSKDTDAVDTHGGEEGNQCHKQQHHIEGILSCDGLGEYVCKQYLHRLPVIK